MTRSSSAAYPSRLGTDGRNTEAVSPRPRARTNRPTAWAKNSGVEVVVAYTPTASRGTSTPSDTIRTATIQRAWESVNVAIFFDAAFSSDSTTVGASPETCLSRAAYARAESWSVAMTRPPASGTCRRTSVSRVSAAASTDGIQAPAGSRAVRRAWALRSWVSGSPSRAATSSPARVRHCISPEYARNSTGRTTWSASACS